MKIGFNPQVLLDNLVMEKFSDNGKSLRRIIEIPAKAQKSDKVLDITYKKSDFLPTQWYVANYNVTKRDGKKILEKTLVSEKVAPNDFHTVVRNYGANGFGREITIDNSNGNLFKTDKLFSSQK